MTKNPAEIAGTRYKNEKLMSRVQKTDGTSRCFAQIENIKRQSLYYKISRKTAVVVAKYMYFKFKNCSKVVRFSMNFMTDIACVKSFMVTVAAFHISEILTKNV